MRYVEHAEAHSSKGGKQSVGHEGRRGFNGRQNALQKPDFNAASNRHSYRVRRKRLRLRSRITTIRKLWEARVTYAIYSGAGGSFDLARFSGPE